MNAVKFDELVKARANQRVNERVEKFRDGIRDAIRKLRPERGSYEINFDADTMSLLACLPSNKWPSDLWRDEEERVSKELLDIMDEMQKAFISIGKTIPDEIIPKED